MRLGVVVLMRNEADIVRPFLQHIGALFDHGILMDHTSTDGTAAILAAAAARFRWHAWRVAVRGFHQDSFTAYAAAHLFRTTPVDHVVLLDADEFLDIPSRAHLEAALAPLAANPRAAGLLTWRNAIPARPNRPLRLSSPLWIAPEPSPYAKAILSRPLFEATGGAARPTIGNHSITPGDDGPVDYHRLGHIIHIPLRSLTQMRVKLLCHTLAFMKRDGATAHRGHQWFTFLDRAARSELGLADLAGMATTYGRSDIPIERINPHDLPTRGFTKRRLRSHPHLPHKFPKPPTPNPLDQLAAVIQDWHTFGDPPASLHLSDNVLSAG